MRYVARLESHASVGEEYGDSLEGEAVDRVAIMEDGVVGEMMHFERTAVHAEVQFGAQTMHGEGCVLDMKVDQFGSVERELERGVHLDFREAMLGMFVIEPKL